MRFVTGAVALIVCMSLRVEGQVGSFSGGSPSTPLPNQVNAPAAPSQPVSPTAAATSENSPYAGSVPSNQPITGTISLTLLDAIQRGLHQNLGLILGNEGVREAHAQERIALSVLRPSLNARATNTVEQIDLASFGFNFHFPGFNIPAVVGPFNVTDVRAYFAYSLLNATNRNNARAAGENVRAAEFSSKENREIVVLLVANGYLQIISDQARVDEVRSEVATAQALFNRAADMQHNGLVPALDSLRAQVELQSEQTRLRSFENDLAKDKLSFARMIGLPLGQEFVPADTMPYEPLALMDFNVAMEMALHTRPDYQGALAQVRAAELSKRAAHDERLPVLDVTGDYGDIGNYPWSSHGTFTAAVGVRVPIYNGGRIRGDIEEADSLLQQRRASLADLRGRIEYDIRSAILDLQTAADQVRVAGSSLDLARQALTQAQDRFTAGVADNIEVVQAQTAVAGASETYISSLYAHNISKALLARAMGVAELRVTEYLKGRKQ